MFVIRFSFYPSFITYISIKADSLVCFFKAGNKIFRIFVQNFTLLICDLPLKKAELKD